MIPEIEEFSGGNVAEAKRLGKELFSFIFCRKVSMLEFIDVSKKYELSTSL
jgi:hypothetical protein